MKKRILSLIMSAVMTASFIVSHCTHAFNIYEYGEVVVTVIDEEANELFKEPGKFGMTMVDDKWDASVSNPYTVKNVPLHGSYFITYAPDGMVYDGYYYAIDCRPDVLFQFEEGEDTHNVTVYMQKRPIENKVEYGTITVTVIDEETNELFTEGREGGKSNFEMTRTYVTNSVPKEGKSDDSASDISGMSGLMGGQIYMGGWNTEQSNPYTFENAMAGNYMYHISHIGIKHDGFTYMIDEEKSDNDFIYSSSEPKEVNIYMKKNYWSDYKIDTQPSNSDTSENLNIQADKNFTFEDIRSMTVEEIQALFELKGIKKSHVHTTNNTQNNFLLDPMPYLSDNIPEDVMAVLKDMSGSNEIIYWFDEEKIKKSLGLPDELFEITVKVSMPIGIDDTPVQKYCECIIQPQTEDLQTRRELLSAAMNYVQLNPDYRDVGVFFEFGGWDNNAMTTTTVSTSTTTTVTTTTAKQTSFEEPVSDSKTTTAIVKTLKGDVNCDDEVDMADAVMIMQALANPNKYGIDGTAEHHLTEQGKTNGDMNGDGLTVGDAQAIQRKLLGLDESAADLEALRKQLSDFFTDEKIDYSVIPKDKMPEQFADKYVFIKVNTADTSYAVRYGAFLKEENIDRELIKSIPYKTDSDTELNRIRELLYCYILENNINASVDPTNEEEDLKNKTVLVKYGDSSETRGQLEKFLKEKHIGLDLVEFIAVE